MLWTALLIVFALVVVLAVALPMRGAPEPWEIPDAKTELDEVLREKARTLRMLKDLDEERLTGLIDDESHAEARAEYMSRAVDCNRRIASLTGEDPSRMEIEEEQPDGGDGA